MCDKAQFSAPENWSSNRDNNRDNRDNMTMIYPIFQGNICCDRPSEPFNVPMEGHNIFLCRKTGQVSLIRCLFLK